MSIAIGIRRAAEVFYEETGYKLEEIILSPDLYCQLAEELHPNIRPAPYMKIDDVWVGYVTEE